MKTFEPPGSFIKHLKESGFLSRRSAAFKHGCEVHYLDLTDLKIRCSPFTPFVIAPQLAGHHIIQPDSILEILEKVKPLTRERGVVFVVLVVGGHAKKNQELWLRLKEGNAALLDRPFIEAIYGAQGPRKPEELCSCFVRSLGYETLSPYVVGKPVVGSRFFGRKRLLGKVFAGKRDASFTILGSRRIGKTSLLRQIQHKLRLQDPQIRTANLYGSRLDSTEEVLEEILEKLEPKKFFKEAAVGDLRKRFQSYVESIPDNEGHDVAVFIDEVDHILEFDSRQEHELMHILRLTFEHEACSIFFAGFRRTRQAMQTDKGPLFNFTDPLEIKRMPRRDANDMITAPLRLFGFDISIGDLPNAIYEETGGHPESIQIFGTEIVSYLENHGCIPNTTAIVSEVLESRRFRDRIYTAFLANTTPYELLVCYLLIDYADTAGGRFEDFDFDRKLIGYLLESQGLDLNEHRLRNLSENLEIGGIITPIEGIMNERFRFSVPQLARYCKRFDLKNSIERTVAGIRRSADEDAVFWNEPTVEED